MVITGGKAAAAFGSIAGLGAGAAPGAGAVVGVMAFDAATVLGATARLVVRTAAYYGYDARQPEEQLFALSVISWSSAGGEGAKTAAFQQLSRLTQQLMRGSTWAQLSEHVLVRVVQELYVRLGLRLTQRKLGQAVPVLGIVLGAGFNASLLRSVADDARCAYRLRFLVEKYQLEDPAQSRVADVEFAEAAIDLGEILGEIESGEVLVPAEDESPDV